MTGTTAQIAYGKTRIPLEMDPGLAHWEIIEPKHEAALADAERKFHEACAAPIGSAPLKELIGAEDKVVIVTSDGTRAVPNELLIPWILDELPCPDENVKVLLGTGTHRPNTPEEIEGMFGADVVSRVEIINHDAFDEGTNRRVGTTSEGAEVFLDTHYLDADKTIVVGFIEPHFFAGFSGGPKGVCPGVGGIDSILYLHNYDMIAHPESTFGILDGNPIHEAVSEMVSKAPPDFMVNVTLNGEKEITEFFVGDYMKAHRVGCEHVRETAMAPVDEAFDIVITSNSGFPLDQNLYQTVKGVSAAVRIVKPGGCIIVASECSDGLPDHGEFGCMLKQADTPEHVLDWIRGLERPRLDQWQAQILSDIKTRCDVALHSSLSPEVVKNCNLDRVEDIQAEVESRLKALGPGARVAVLPEGPLTIPYVR